MKPQPEIDWKSVVSLIQQGDQAGEEILYRELAGGARLFLQRRLGAQDVEDRVHDIFLTIVDAIRRGAVQQPERLMGFVRTVLHRHLNEGITRNIRNRERVSDLDEAAAQSDAGSTPEESAIAGERLELMTKVLREMSDRDFEVLTRFYIREHPPDRICREMGLTQVQFQLLKSRAKARLAELTKRAMRPSGPNRQ